MSHCAKTNTIRCHYDILGVERTADAATVKKAHRKLALKYHPDKNIDTDNSSDNNTSNAAIEFRLVQQAYECLSDASERKWYDEHREAILKGWSTNNDDGDMSDMLFDVNPYMYAGCYNGFHDDDTDNFFAVYSMVFSKIYDCENRFNEQDSHFDLDVGMTSNNRTNACLLRDFGNASTSWEDVQQFYQCWESFSSTLNFSWVDEYDITEAPSRQYRRAMEDENKKLRKLAKKQRNDEIIALVKFVKRRDIRVIAKKRQIEEENMLKAIKQKEDAEIRKQEAMVAREAWKQQAANDIAFMEEQDRLAGRIRLADLDDDYDYGGGKKKGKKKKNKGKNSNKNSNDNEEQSASSTKNNDNDEDNNNGEDNDDNDSHEQSQPINEGEICISKTDANQSDITNGSGVCESNEMNGRIASSTPSEQQDPGDIDSNVENPVDESTRNNTSDEDDNSDDEPEFWRCECCRKDFKSEGQMENHLRSKKHKDALKKYEKGK